MYCTHLAWINLGKCRMLKVSRCWWLVSKLASECGCSWVKATSSTKVSILGVELLLPFCAWLFQGCKNPPILDNLAVNKISSKLKILHWIFFFQIWNVMYYVPLSVGISLQSYQIATTPKILTLLLGLLELSYRHQKPNQKRKNLCTQNLEN